MTSTMNLKFILMVPVSLYVIFISQMSNAICRYLQVSEIDKTWKRLVWERYEKIVIQYSEQTEEKEVKRFQPVMMGNNQCVGKVRFKCINECVWIFCITCNLQEWIVH